MEGDPILDHAGDRFDSIGAVDEPRPQMRLPIPHRPTHHYLHILGLARSVAPVRRTGEDEMLDCDKDEQKREACDDDPRQRVLQNVVHIKTLKPPSRPNQAECQIPVPASASRGTRPPPFSPAHKCRLHFDYTEQLIQENVSAIPTECKHTARIRTSTRRSTHHLSMRR